MSTQPPDRPVACVGAVVWKDDRVLLIRRGKPPAEGSWSLPGGRQERGETIFEAAEREVHEETGVSIRILDVAAVIDLIERDGAAVTRHYLVVDVVAEWTGGEPRPGDDAADAVWAGPDDWTGFGLTDAVRRVISLSTAKRQGTGPRSVIG